MTWVLLGGILMLNTFPQLLLAGIILFAMTTLFSFITLPVEINAVSYTHLDVYKRQVLHEAADSGQRGIAHMIRA